MQSLFIQMLRLVRHLFGGDVLFVVLKILSLIILFLLVLILVQKYNI